VRAIRVERYYTIRGSTNNGVPVKFDVNTIERAPGLAANPGVALSPMDTGSSTPIDFALTRLVFGPKAATEVTQITRTTSGSQKSSLCGHKYPPIYRALEAFEAKSP
jgi:hypothetical protein